MLYKQHSIQGHAWNISLYRKTVYTHIAGYRDGCYPNMIATHLCTIGWKLLHSMPLNGARHSEGLEKTGWIPDYMWNNFAEARIQSQTSECEIYGRQNGTGSGFRPSTWAYSSQYHYSNASYSPSCIDFFKRLAKLRNHVVMWFWYVSRSDTGPRS